MRALRHLWRDRRGASAAEFALVLPLFLVLLLGVIDTGRLLWELNTIKKATQVGARLAAVTAPVDTSLATLSFVGFDPGSGVLTQGDIIPANTLGAIRCTKSACTCPTTPCPGTRVHNATAFNTIVARMNAHFDGIDEDNVVVYYKGSGLGFAGDPSGPDLSPTIEVVVNDPVIATANRVKFTPVTAFLFAQFDLPAARTSMTGEDQAGAASY